MFSKEKNKTLKFNFIFVGIQNVIKNEIKTIYANKIKGALTPLKQVYCSVVQTRQNVIELNWEHRSVMWKIITELVRRSLHAPVAGVCNRNPANDNLFSTPLILK